MSHKQITPSIAQSASSVPQPATTVSAVPLPPTVSGAQAAPSATGAFPLSNIPEQLWDRAYDDLKDDEPIIVEAYEKVLSRELDGNASSSLASENQRNAIEQANRELRRSQMSRLVKTGLEKTEREAKVKRGIGNAMQVVLAANDTIGSAVQACPQAALAWAGVSLALQASLPPRDYNDGS